MEKVSSSGTSKPPAGIGDTLKFVQIKCPVKLPPSFRKKKQWCDISLGISPTVNQVSKNLCFILMTQAYGSIDFDDLFVSISTLTLSPGFAFCQVELQYTWYPLDAILLSNEYILLMCYDTKKLVLLKISVIRFLKQ